MSLLLGAIKKICRVIYYIEGILGTRQGYDRNMLVSCLEHTKEMIGTCSRYILNVFVGQIEDKDKLVNETYVEPLGTNPTLSPSL